MIERYFKKEVYGSGNNWIEVGRVGVEWIGYKGWNKFKG
jgi:hypothetical protein